MADGAARHAKAGGGGYDDDRQETHGSEHHSKGGLQPVCLH
jgi:hypothetical protein